MSGSSPRAPDEARLSAVAALAALGGHAVIILAALTLSGRSQTVVVTPGVVGVTLVSGAPGGPAASLPAAPDAARPAPSTAVQTPAPETTAGERLDRLIAPDPAAPAMPSTTPAPSPPMAANRPTASGPPNPSAAAKSSGGSGSSRADQGLGQGEGAEGIDLYAAASLPNVGARPASTPDGDLWKKVAPCWRSAAPRTATLMVEIAPDGRLINSPKAVRKLSAPADPQLLLAERAATRALQACAPYNDLGGRTWRVTFP